MTPIVLPGSTIGVLGSGQLGRMFTLKARRMGYRVHTYSPDYDTPTGQVADVEVCGEYDDLDRVRDFAANVDVVTFEFENVPAITAETAEGRAPVRPAGSVLHVTQHRLREKTFLKSNGFPVPEFTHIHSMQELEAAIAANGCPCVLKTAGWGYDGKGQSKILDGSDLSSAWKAVGEQESVLEQFVDFERELSVIGARGMDGTFVSHEIFENTHANHILDVTVSPAPVPETVAKDAVEITRGIMEKLEVVGVLCVEFFLTRSGTLLVNELAPRPHNSGHLTFDAAVTSQFEQQLRAVCGLPLGNPGLLRPAAMVNLLGDLWVNGEPDWAAACAMADVKIHLYGKREARPGRKMGHLTALAQSVESAKNAVLAARETLIHRA
ncbi:MAG: N5-carboxyaminoimidazole ribonucleotide synthase [Candidatus Hydrogenedentota bacterium]